MKTLLQSKKLVDPVTEYASHVLVLRGFNIPPKLFKDGVKTIDSFLVQNTNLWWIVSESPGSQYATAHVPMAE